ncbi:MAG: U32 family peptidase [Candidatus Ancillula trichonymphae]|jgi:putative protease|nr:U32 family peptidase [Candidatus Ancillula trichonymphae]
MHPEILAPAGELEQLFVAVQYGADAIYLAAQEFGMRSAPKNFTFEELAEAVQYAHEHGVRVYQTVNILPTNSQISGLEDFLRNSRSAGVDAFIVADIGVLMLARRVVPDVELHISVQAGVTNYLTASELYQLGAKRVVLARELTLHEIAQIRAKIPDDMEIECFVHGAICMAFSGRCLISKYMINRDSNQGLCAQPCRWEYTVVDSRVAEGGGHQTELEIVEEREVLDDNTSIARGSYIFNSKDLNLLEHLHELTASGVSSFKIEGRAKSSYYVATIVHAYRAAWNWFETHSDDEPLPDWILAEASKVSHRDYTTGFYFAGVKAGGEVVDAAYDPELVPDSYHEKGYKQLWRPLAALLDDGWHQRGKFLVDDECELLIPSGRSQGPLKPISVKVRRILDETGLNVQSAPHADQLLSLKFCENAPQELPCGTFLRGRTAQ